MSDWLGIWPGALAAILAFTAATEGAWARAALWVVVAVGIVLAGGRRPRRSGVERRARRIERRVATGTSVLVFFLASELFDRDDGSKGQATWVIAGLLAMIAYALAEWVRRDPSRS